MPGVGLRHRSGTDGNQVADQQAQAVRAPQPRGAQAQLGGKRLVEHEEPGVGSLFGFPGDGHLRKVAGELVGQGHGR